MTWFDSPAMVLGGGTLPSAPFDPLHIRGWPRPLAARFVREPPLRSRFEVPLRIFRRKTVPLAREDVVLVSHLQPAIDRIKQSVSRAMRRARSGTSISFSSPPRRTRSAGITLHLDAPRRVRCEPIGPPAPEPFDTEHPKPTARHGARLRGIRNFASSSFARLSTYSKPLPFTRGISVQHLLR